ncbi:metal ABC transporter permease [Candidatus Gracilibacteria bacterium]|nr:metal ABC transporter permease [Candidatus Gracilibacteria bacterium]
MIRALLAGIFTAISTAILGNFVVASRQSIISDMLSHTALAGVGLGIFLHLSPTLFAFIVTFLTSFLLWYLTRSHKSAPEAISMMLLSGGLALALLFSHAAKDNPISLETYLFGSILTITQNELYFFIIVNLFIIGFITFFWRQLLTLVFDKDFFKTKNPHAAILEISFMLLIASIVGIGMKIIGGLLIGAMLVIPVLTAQTFSRNFFQNVVWSIIINIFGVILGIFSSFYFDIPTSSGIVLSLIFFFLCSRLWKRK